MPGFEIKIALIHRLRKGSLKLRSDPNSEEFEMKPVEPR